MMRDSTPAVVERPGLEDVAEEEDPFAAEGRSKSTLKPSSCQVRGWGGGVYWSVLPFFYIQPA